MPFDLNHNYLYPGTEKTDLGNLRPRDARGHAFMLLEVQKESPVRDPFQLHFHLLINGFSPIRRKDFILRATRLSMVGFQAHTL
jgi:hypothetical protein